MFNAKANCLDRLQHRRAALGQTGALTDWEEEQLCLAFKEENKKRMKAIDACFKFAE